MTTYEKIVNLKEMGLTFEQIGYRLGISRQRAEQVLHKETYRAKQRHYEHSFSATPNWKLRKPCSYCGDKV